MCKGAVLISLMLVLTTFSGIWQTSALCVVFFVWQELRSRDIV